MLALGVIAWSHLFPSSRTCALVLKLENQFLEGES